MQPGQEQFLVDNSGVGGSRTLPHSARREQRYPCEMRGEKNERQVTFHLTNGRGRSSAAESFDNEFRQHRDELEREIGRIARELEEMRHTNKISSKQPKRYLLLTFRPLSEAFIRRSWY